MTTIPYRSAARPTQKRRPRIRPASNELCVSLTDRLTEFVIGQQRGGHQFLILCDSPQFRIGHAGELDQKARQNAPLIE